MEKEKGNFFVSNQGGLQPLPEIPLWEDAGGTTGELIKRSKKSEPPFEMDPATLEEIKGGERLW